MTFYEIKLNVVIDRNSPQALKHLRSALEEMFEKNRHLNKGNVNLVSIEEKKKKCLWIIIWYKHAIYSYATVKVPNVLGKPVILSSLLEIATKSYEDCPYPPEHDDPPVVYI